MEGRYLSEPTTTGYIDGYPFLIPRGLRHLRTTPSPLAGKALGADEKDNTHVRRMDACLYDIDNFGMPRIACLGVSIGHKSGKMDTCTGGCRTSLRPSLRLINGLVIYCEAA